VAGLDSHELPLGGVSVTRVAVVGPVYPYRAGIAYCTTRLSEELAKSCDVSVISFSRQYPKLFYPGSSDIDETLGARTPAGASFALDVINPFTWMATAFRLRRARYDAVVLVWWIWVWALPYLVLLLALPHSTRIVLQCHNIGDKEPARWKRWLTNLVLRRGDVLVVHAKSEAADAARRVPGATIITTFLPVHELGREIPTRGEARAALGIESARNVALFFGHIRPFKALDVALRAWAQLHVDALLLVAGEAWWKSEEEYRSLATTLGLLSPQSKGHDGRVSFDFRFIPDSEIATYFAASDVVLAPYRVEAQSGVALTAFYFSRPVIASNVGGLPEVIEEGVNGYLVTPDPAALSVAIDRFFSIADRGSFEAAAAATARRCSWAEYGELFRGLVEQSAYER
jgi:glycosyltransferase involved in cell wall biosynthesis